MCRCTPNKKTTMSSARLPDLTISSVAPETNSKVIALIAEIRARANCFVFLSGGAAHIGEDEKRQLLSMFDALRLLVAAGYRIAVGDGGTQFGIMEVAGQARLASNNAFPLIGVAPAADIPPLGNTPIDPHHSHVVAVQNPAAPAKHCWGFETETMYWLFARIAEARPSVTIVANGGEIALDEVDANIRARRQMILVEGSGRTADAIGALLKGTDPADVRLYARAQERGLTRRPELFRFVALTAGAPGLRAAIVAAFGRGPIN
jgi:hypothetical protein